MYLPTSLNRILRYTTFARIKRYNNHNYLPSCENVRSTLKLVSSEYKNIWTTLLRYFICSYIGDRLRYSPTACTASSSRKMPVTRMVLASSPFAGDSFEPPAIIMLRSITSWLFYEYQAADEPCSRICSATVLHILYVDLIATQSAMALLLLPVN